MRRRLPTERPRVSEEPKPPRARSSESSSAVYALPVRRWTGLDAYIIKVSNGVCGVSLAGGTSMDGHAGRVEGYSSVHMT